MIKIIWNSILSQKAENMGPYTYPNDTKILEQSQNQNESLHIYSYGNSLWRIWFF